MVMHSISYAFEYYGIPQIPNSYLIYFELQSSVEQYSAGSNDEQHDEPFEMSREGENHD